MNERELRNITDYILSCFSRVEDHIALIAAIKKNRKLFTGKYRFIALSLCDVYSRDIIITLNQTIDQDIATSSLFSLVKNIKKPRIHKKFEERLKLIKKDLNALVRLRNNQVGHFNTKLNIWENGYSHIHTMYWVMKPRDTRKIIKQLENFFWDIKAELKIDGVGGFFAGDLASSFQELIAGI